MEWIAGNSWNIQPEPIEWRVYGLRWKIGQTGEPVKDQWSLHTNGPLDDTQTEQMYNIGHGIGRVSLS